MFYQPEEGRWLERSEVESEAFKSMELGGYDEEEIQRGWEAELLRVRRAMMRAEELCLLPDRMDIEARKRFGEDIFERLRKPVDDEDAEEKEKVVGA